MIADWLNWFSLFQVCFGFCHHHFLVSCSSLHLQVVGSLFWYWECSSLGLISFLAILPFSFEIVIFFMALFLWIIYLSLHFWCCYVWPCTMLPSILCYVSLWCIPRYELVSFPYSSMFKWPLQQQLSVKIGSYKCCMTDDLSLLAQKVCMTRLFDCLGHRVMIDRCKWRSLEHNSMRISPSCPMLHCLHHWYSYCHVCKWCL